MLPQILLALCLQQTASEPLELVESFPAETTLDHADLRDADVVWRELIDGATSSLDFAEFYASDSPGSKLASIVESIERAALRGVRVRFLAEKKFQITYPEVLERLARTKGIEVRTYDVKALTGGILHAKYFLVDGTTTYLGSQNFDWRSFEHIQELGVVVRSRAATALWQSVYDADWALAGGASVGDAIRAPAGAKFPLEIGSGTSAARITPVVSPAPLLPDAESWDLPKIVALIDGAKKTVRIQLLTYKMSSGNDYFADLENALRRAASRGVSVQLLVADWCMRKGTIEGLQALEPLANVEVALVTIPQWSGGFVPYARVVHAKYLVVDGERAWIGTSNWERDYFFQSRNVGLIVEGGSVPKRLDAFFADGWKSPYAKPVDPCAAYKPPKIGD